MEKKTLEQHKEYLKECVKLSLWVIADWKTKHPQEDIIWIIHERTTLVSHTIFNPNELYDVPSFTGEKWPELRLQLREIFERNNDIKNFETQGFNLLEPYIYGRAEKDLIGINSKNSNSWIRYDVTNKQSEYMEIHMENSLYPNSFLADEDYFNEKLKIAVLDAEKNGFKGLWTCSWLNDLPTWQKRMPKQWTESIKNRQWDIEWHLGFWGQFLTANQCFNYKIANKFRDTGKIPFPMSRAETSLEILKLHLGI